MDANIYTVPTIMISQMVRSFFNTTLFDMAGYSCHLSYFVGQSDISNLRNQNIP